MVDVRCDTGTWAEETWGVRMQKGVHLESEVRAGVEAYSSSDAHSSSEHLVIMTLSYVHSV